MIKELNERQMHLRYRVEGSAHARDALMLKAAVGESPAWDAAADGLLLAVLADIDGLESVPAFVADVYVNRAAHAVALLALHLAGGDHDGAQLLLRGTRAHRAADSQS